MLGECLIFYTQLFCFVTLPIAHCPYLPPYRNWEHFKQVQADWAFIDSMRSLAEEQKEAFGVIRLHDERDQLRSITSALQSVCHPGKGASRAHGKGGEPQTDSEKNIESTIKRMQAGIRPCSQVDESPRHAVHTLANSVRGMLPGSSTEQQEMRTGPPLQPSKSSASLCSEDPRAVFRCMLEKYDDCKAGVGPRTMCDYFDSS